VNRPIALLFVLAVSMGALACESGSERAPAATSGAHPPTAIVLNPTATPTTSQTITWRTAAAYSTQRVAFHRAVDTKARYAYGHRKPATTVRNSGSAQPAYTATMTGLEPGTRYVYRVVTSGGSSSRYSFTTPDASVGEGWQLLSFGDTQIDNANVPKRIIAAATKRFRAADLMLQAGDVVNHPWEHREWVGLFSALTPTRYSKNWAISIGNHEQCILVTSCRSNRGEGFRTYFTWPDNGYAQQRDTWFYTDYPGVRLVVLDDFASDVARQAAFLDTALADNPQQWSVVLMHAGPFASRADRTNATVRTYLLPIIRKHDVDLVLNGHDHSYARGYVGDPDSTVFATSVSGPKYYTTSGKDWRDHGASKIVTARDISTYQVVDVSGSTLRYRAVVVSKGARPAAIATGFTPSTAYGAALDTVTITKSGGTKTVDW
jgi:hypothetical protein